MNISERAKLIYDLLQLDLSKEKMLMAIEVHLRIVEGSSELRKKIERLRVSDHTIDLLESNGMNGVVGPRIRFKYYNQAIKEVLSLLQEEEDSTDL